MPLSNFFKNYCTILTNEHAGVDQEGAVARDFSYVPMKINIPCAIQGKNRLNVELEYGKKGQNTLYTFYHQERSLIGLVGPHCLIITAKSFFQKLPDSMPDIRDIKQDVRVFEFRGHREAVGHEIEDMPLEIYGEENFRWKF